MLPAPDRRDSVLAGAGLPRITRRALVTEERDARLVELVHAGDHRAFEVLIERYRPALVIHCRGIVGDAAAQDAVQQASISAWQALRRGQDVSHVRAWLYAIARHAALETLRREESVTAELPETLPGGLSPERLIEQSAHARATLAAVADLPPRERDALVWTSLHGRSGREAARALGVSEGAIRQLIVRARARARAAIHVLVPPILVARLPALHAPRRVAALVQRPPGGLASLLAAGALVGAPIAAVKLAPRAPVPTHAGTASRATAGPPATAHSRERLQGAARARRGAPARQRRAGAPAATVRSSAPAGAAEATRPNAATPDPGGPPQSAGGAGKPGSPVSTLTGQASQPAVAPPSLPATPAPPQPPAEIPVVKAVTGLTEDVGPLAETAQGAAKDLTSGVEGAVKQALEGVRLP